MMREFTSILTTGTGTAYAQNDVIGDLKTIALFSYPGDGWRFAGANMSDLDNLGAFHYVLMFFNEPVTLAADNAAWSMTAAHAKSFLGMVGPANSSSNALSAGGTNRNYTIPATNISTHNPHYPVHVEPGLSDLNLYMAVLASGATAPAARTTATSLVIRTLWEKRG